MQHLPNAMALLHPRGARHMIDPGKLITGSEAVYGTENVRQMYGEILPIDKQRVRVVADNEEVRLVVHAGDHARLVLDGHARGGERGAGGLDVVHLVVDDGGRVVQLRGLRAAEHQADAAAVEEGGVRDGE